MLHPLLEGAIAIAVAAAMDFWAAFLHRRFWHGPLWWIHRTHHAPRAGRFERNDVLSTLHAPIAVALIVLGSRRPPGWLRDMQLGVGYGMTLFGALYLLLHDGLVHRRLPVSALLRVPALRAIVRAHRLHHRAGGGPPYGILFGRWESRRAARTPRRAPGRTPSAPPPRAPAHE